MNKKGGLDGSEISMILCALIIVLGIIVLSMSDISNEALKCQEDCPTYNATFVDYTPGNTRYTSECWCKRGVEPLRIW